MVVTYVFSLLVSVYVIMILLPLIKNDYWTFRVLEYPRLQKLSIGVLLFITCILSRERIGNIYWGLLLLLAACILYLLYTIYPYTILSPVEMKRVKNENDHQDLKLFAANVLQENTCYEKLMEQITSYRPHVVFLVETNAAWQNGMKAMEGLYPHTLHQPLENTYGLLLYSQLPLLKKEIRYLADKEVPSVLITVQLPSGAEVVIYGLHPKPPVPGESMYSTAKDKELMKVAFEVEGLQKPCIVMGDLNDVAWSYVTKLFQKVSGLLDPRRGRGFYSTFSAKHWWMRFPLDYIFCSSHFGLVSMKKMPHNGSDHFAMFIHLKYLPHLQEVQEKPVADEKEKEEAAEKATSPVPAEPEKKG